MVKEEISILNSENDLFKIDIRHNKEKKVNEYETFLLICPGFMAFKDWGPFPDIGEQLSSETIATIVMNYSHNGINENRYKITDFKKFFDNTVSKEIDDILSVIKWIKNVVSSGTDKLKIILMGHSRGAANCIVVASQDIVDGLITISPISHYDRWNEHQKESWRKYGYLELSADKSVSRLKIGINYLKDLELNKNKYDLLRLSRVIRNPWLIIHGENDVVARIDEAKSLYEASNKKTTELNIIPAMGHMLGYNLYKQYEENLFLQKVLRIIKQWLNKNF